MLLFALISFSGNFIVKAELTPFIRWDMYAEPIPKQATYTITEVRYNDNKLLNIKPTWMQPEKTVFINTLDLYLALKKNNNEDPLKKYYAEVWKGKHPFFNKYLPALNMYNGTMEIERFQAWYANYLSQYTKEKIYSINVYEKQIAFDEKGDIKELSSTLICKLL
ncbi:MAG: hypothetical protein ABJA79_11425 [Parafilimonas sp.]